jgi:hypothetical protein
MLAAFRRFAMCTCLATGLIATCTFAGGRVEERARDVSVEIGPWVSMSVPTGVAGDQFDRGVNAGVSITTMRTRMVGAGADLGYGLWSSPAAGAALDALFTAFGTTPVSGTKYTMAALRGSLHVKVVPLPGGRVAPWVQVSAGVCRVNKRLQFPADQLRAAGWQVLKESSDEISYEPLLVTGVGFDLKTRTGMKLGLDASYQWLVLADNDPAFTAFTIGGHILFGRW